MNVQNYNINVRVGTGITQNVKLSQGDIGRELVFFLYDGAVRFSPPSGATVKIKGTKPSGLGFDVACTLSGSIARVSTTLAMTQEGGNIPAELEISNGSNVIGTANFVMHVEPSPHPAGTTDGTTEEARTVLAQCEAYAELAQEAAVAASGDYTEIRSDVDDLTDRVAALEAGGSGSGLTEDIKTALMSLVNHLAWDDDDPTGQTYITALYNALYPPADLVSISAVYTQSGVVYDTDSLNSLKSDLVVTAHMSDQTSQSIVGYSLVGTLTVGTSTITVSYSGKTTTFNVTVTKEWDYEWSYTDGVMPEDKGFTAAQSENGNPSATLESDGLTLQVTGPSSWANRNGFVGYTYPTAYDTGVLEVEFKTLNANRDSLYIILSEDGEYGVGLRAQVSQNYQGIYLLNGATIGDMEKLATTATNSQYKVKMVMDNGLASVYINDVLVKENIVTAEQYYTDITRVVLMSTANGTPASNCKLLHMRLKVGRTV